MFTPTRCLVPHCASETVFGRSEQYRKHVKRSHGLKGKEIDAYMPYEKKAKFTPTKCQVPLCSSQATFKLPNQYTGHLLDKHPHLTQEEVDELVG